MLIKLYETMSQKNGVYDNDIIYKQTLFVQLIHVIILFRYLLTLLLTLQTEEFNKYDLETVTL